MDSDVATTTPLARGLTGRLLGMTYPRVAACGDNALSIELGERIDPMLHDKVVALLKLLSQADLPILDMVPTFRSILVEYDGLVMDYAGMSERVLGLVATIGDCAERGRSWEVPVVYGGQFGVDLPAYARGQKLTPDEVIRRHCRPAYRVYMIGFTPGFTYLGGLDPVLAAPRLATPRREVHPGAVSIGGSQTAISGVAAPSGWHQIGRTPVRTFWPTRTEPSLFAPNDTIAFVPISEAEWQSLALAAYRGEIVARRLA